MAEEISSIIASARARLQAELDTHLGVIAEQHRQTIAETRAETREAHEAAARTRQDLEQALAAARLVEEQRRSSETGLFAAFRTIDSTGNVSETLTAISHAASSIASRTALFVAQDGQLAEWTIDGAKATTVRPLHLDDPSAGVLAAAIRDRALTRGDVPAALAPDEPGRKAVAVPLLLENVPVAVIYAEQEDASPTDGSWTERLELLASHSATRLGYLTAVRTAQAMRWIAGATTPVPSAAAPVAAPSSSDEEEQSAKRYARLLISEIKLYNEAAVRTGRERRDLLKRLESEVERARRLYEQRVPPSLPDRARHFDHELVQTLAGGDALLLG